MKTERVTEASKTGYSYFHSSATASAFCIAAGTSSTNTATTHAQTATAHKHRISGAALGDEAEDAAAAAGALARAARMREVAAERARSAGFRAVFETAVYYMLNRTIKSTYTGRRARRARSRAANPGSTLPVRSGEVPGQAGGGSFGREVVTSPG